MNKEERKKWEWKTKSEKMENICEIRSEDCEKYNSINKIVGFAVSNNRSLLNDCETGEEIKRKVALFDDIYFRLIIAILTVVGVQKKKIKIQESNIFPGHQAFFF